MVQYGFNAYDQEWWHFTLKNEPYPRKYFNFNVQ
jgi:D-alanyl-D-alanine dipeptidase